MQIDDLNLDLEEVGGKTKPRLNRESQNKYGIERFLPVLNPDGTHKTDPATGRKEWILNFEYALIIEQQQMDEAAALRAAESKTAELMSQRDVMQQELEALEDELERQTTTKDELLEEQGYELQGKEQTIQDLNELLDSASGPKMNAQRAFANVSREDTNLLWYGNNLKNKRAREKEDKERKARAYELRAFNRDYIQSEIAMKLREFENIPHMTTEDRSKWLAKKSARKIHSEADIPDNFRGEERTKWLAMKNKKQKLYENHDSAYDQYMRKQKQLDSQFSDGNKYKTNYTYRYTYTY